MTKLFNNTFTPLLVVPGGRAKYFDLNPGSVVQARQSTDGFTEVSYFTNQGVEKIGWIKTEHLEMYVENLPKDCVQIDFQTANPNDFEQYLIWDGHRVVNACGEIAVARILGLPLKDTIENWKLKSPSVWKRIQGKGKWTGTGPADLIDLLATFAVPAVSLSTVMKKYTMTGLQKLLDEGDIIVSCNIGYDGRFRGKEILHWSNVEAVHPERLWGWVDVMNPAPNRIERYSWNEFLASCGQPYGVFVPDGFRTAAKPLEVE